MAAMDCRAAAARTLAQVIAGQSLNKALPQQLDKVAERDRGLLQELCYGSLRQWPRLAAIAAQLLDKPLRSKDQDIQALIILGLYQLSDTRIPDHAAVASTVAATRALSKPWAKGLVNALLRRYQRDSEQLYSKLDPAADLAHPQWLYQRLLQDWGEQQAKLIMATNNSRPPMTLRVNLSRISRDNYQHLLQEQGIESEAGAYSDAALYLKQPLDVTALPGFASALVSVQDEAAQLAAQLLAPQAGERILDACAAPGGKTCHALELQPEIQELVALDIDSERLSRVAENLERLGLSATLLAADAAEPPAQLETHSFDRILVDAPCSASGVIRRHPDIKLLRRDRDIEHLAEQQLAILKGLWPLLKPGGRLLYVTCSVLDRENSATIQAFLSQQADAQHCELASNWGQRRDFGIQLLPQDKGPDGLFFAALQKAC